MGGCCAHLGCQMRPPRVSTSGARPQTEGSKGWRLGAGEGGGGGMCGEGQGGECGGVTVTWVRTQWG